MSVFTKFNCWNMGNIISQDNYSSNYLYKNSVWHGSSTALSMGRKTTAVTMSNITAHGFKIFWRSFGTNDESAVVNCDIQAETFWQQSYLLRTASPAARAAAIEKFKAKGIDLENPEFWVGDVAREFDHRQHRHAAV